MPPFHDTVFFPPRAGRFLQEGRGLKLGPVQVQGDRRSPARRFYPLARDVGRESSFALSQRDAAREVGGGEGEAWWRSIDRHRERGAISP